LKWGPIVSCSIIIFFIVLFQWPKIKKDQKREKIAFVIITGFGWLLATLLFLFPDLPSPTDLVDFIFKPFGRLLE
jgi:multisubunit Na+/H+ antiporter MnhB subunit